MSSIWNAPAEIQRLVLKEKEGFQYLQLAKLWVLVTDAKGIKDNQLVITETKKCTKTEHLENGSDFKITVFMESWAKLTDEQQRYAILVALTRCGVHLEPQVIEINGKKVPMKDDLGRTLFTGEVSYDKEGRPRWKINNPDAEIYYSMIQRVGVYDESIDNTKRVLEGKPIIEQAVAEHAAVD